MEKRYDELTIVYICPIDHSMTFGISGPLVARGEDRKLYQLLDVYGATCAKVTYFSPDEYQYYTEIIFRENVSVPAIKHHVPLVLSKLFVETLKEAGVSYHGNNINWQPLGTDCLFSYIDLETLASWRKEKFSAYALYIKQKLSALIRNWDEPEEWNKKYESLLQITETAEPLRLLRESSDNKKLFRSLILLIGKLHKKLAKDRYRHWLKISLLHDVFTSVQSAEAAVSELEMELKSLPEKTKNS